jgi:hypothetical protein
MGYKSDWQRVKRMTANLKMEEADSAKTFVATHKITP